MKRRNFLFAGAGAPLLPQVLSAQRGAPTERAPLPASVTALKNRRAEALPIPVSERDQRIERARSLMSQTGIDAVCVAGGITLSYFTGVRWGNSERLFACVLPKKGDPFYVCPGFEEDRAREQLTKSERIYTWQEDENPFALVGKGLRDAGISMGRVGIDEKMPFAFADGIALANPQLHTTSATPVTGGCRASKSPGELALMKLANNVTLQAYAAAWKSVHEGMTTAELRGWIEGAFAVQGFPGGAVSVQVGEFTALPHGSSRPQQIREGTVVMMDDGCSVEGYVADVTRTCVLGRATDRMKQVYDIVHRAQDAALAAAKPGAACESVDTAARKVIVDAGFGPGYKNFTHRLGHGIGLEGHEWPYLVRGNKTPMVPGMTFSDEPGIYIRGEFGVRLEDCMYITAAGAELFTPQSHSIETPFA